MLGLVAFLALPPLALAQTITKGAEAEMAVPPMKGKVYALVVGVSDYKNDMINDLRYAAADARAVAEYLKTGPLKVEKLIELYDKDATRSGIQNKGLAVIDGLVFEHVVQPEDMILVYLSGHGGAFTKDNSFFFPHDAAHATDAGTSFSIKRIKGKIRDWSTESKATVVFVFDACRSATLAKGQAELDLAEVSKYLEEDTGEVLLAASQGGEPALEKAELRHGVFSFCLLEALYGKADKNGDQWVSVGELKAYLDANVADRTEAAQQPMIKYPVGFQKKLVAPVAPDLLARADEKLKLDLSSTSVVQLAAKGGSSSAKAEQLSDLIAMFREAVDNGKLVRPATECAYYYFQQMTKLVPVSGLQTELTDLKVALYDKALTTLTEDINGERNYLRTGGQGQTYNTDYYGDAQLCLEAYVQLMGKRTMDPDLDALRYYLTGRNYHVQYLKSNFKNADLIKRATKTLQEGVAKYPGQAYLWQGLASTYLADTKANYAAATQAATTARELAPRWSYPLITLADCAFDQNDQAGALKLIEDAMALNELDFISFYTAGYMLSVSGRKEEALEKYKKAVELNPDYVNAYYGWGLVLSNLGRHDEAIEKHKRATQLDSLNANAYCAWGYALDALGKKEDAIEKFKKATELDPEFALAYQNWGIVLRELGRNEEALEKFERVCELAPGHARAYYLRGVAFDDLGKLEEASEMYEKSMQLAPGSADMYFKWGAALRDLDRKKEAIEKFEQAIKLYPTFGWAYYNVAKLQGELGQTDVAERNYQTAIDVAGWDHWLLAWCYFGLKDWDKSQALFEEIIRLEPNEGAAFYNYACFLALTGRPTDALQQLENAFTKGWKNWSHLERDGDLKSLRGLKEFNDLVVKYKKP